MNSRLAKKLLIAAIGVLFLLLAVLYQLKSTSPQATKISTESQTDLSALLRNSLLQQRKNFQRCWLQNTTNNDQQVWQLYFTVQSTGRVKNFDLLNKSFFPEETEKCLRDIALRLKFPTFNGEEVSFTIPIKISALNDNH